MLSELKNANSSSDAGLERARYMAELQRFAKPNPAIYWADFLLTNLLGNALLAAAVMLDSFSAGQILAIIAAGVVLFRATVFVHEVHHLDRRMKSFMIGYNLIYGFLHKFPSHMHAAHRFHHLPQTYGTKEDAEYEPFASQPLPAIVAPFFSIILIPAFLIVRHGFLPLLLPFIGKRGRNFVHAHLSTFALNLAYKRRPASKAEARSIAIQEFGCALYNAVFFGLMIAGILPFKLLAVWYAVFYVVYLLNLIRAIASHRYESGAKQTSFEEQILDSLTVDVSWHMSAWIFPVGLRYHALHHLYPAIPYHNLAAAHRRLLELVPPDHVYRKTLKTGVGDAVAPLFASRSMRPDVAVVKKRSEA